MDKVYNNLDDVAEDFKPGTIVIFEGGHKGVVVGYVYSLPLEAGGRDEPAILVNTPLGLGNVYPHEVKEKR